MDQERKKHRKKNAKLHGQMDFKWEVHSMMEQLKTFMKEFAIEV